MSGSGKTNSRDNWRASEARMATLMISNMESHYPWIGMLMPLPQPGTPGAPYFTGKNVSEFLKTWENLCKDYQVSSADQLRKLPRYCARLIGLYIETIPEYQTKD